MSIEKFSAIVIATAIAILSGCGDSGYSGPTVSAGSATTLGVQAVDANTQEPITNATLTITSGADKFDGDGTENTGVAAIASFTVKEGNDPTSESIAVSVKASANGYLDSNQSTTITTTGAIDLQVALVSTDGSSLPTGVGVESQSFTSSDGTPSSTITAEAASTNNAGGEEKSSIEIGESVEMRDANGNLVTGDITATVAYYDANSTEALEAFPGGFTVAVENASAAQTNNDANTTGEIGSDNELTFISGGFTAVEIKNDTGDKVKNFSAPVPITFTISEDTVNPDTGTTVAVNQELPIWSFDADTGKWTYEGQGRVEENGDTTDGLLQVTYEVNHLSYWNLDWYRSGTRRCTGRINVYDRTTGLAYPYRLKVQIANASGNSRTVYYTGDGFIHLNNLLRGVSTTATFIDMSTNQPLDGVDQVSIDCGDGNEVRLPPLVQEETNLTVQTVTYCSNDSSVADTVVPSVYVYLAQQSPNWSYVGRGYTNSSGEQVFNNLVTSSSRGNHQYTLKAYDRINSTWRLATNQVFSGDADTYQFRFPQTCDVTTGSTGSTGAEGGGN